MLRALTAVELVVVSVYESLAQVAPVAGAGADPAIRVAVTTALGHHRQHLAALKSYTEAAGGVAQLQPDPHYQPVAEALVKGIRTAAPGHAPAAASSAAASFENVAAASCATAASGLASTAARALVSSIATVEAQHLAVLQVIESLLAGHDQRLLTFPVDGAALPSTALQSGLDRPALPLSGAAPSLQDLVP